MSTFLSKLKAVKDSLVLTMQMAMLATDIDDAVKGQDSQDMFGRLADFNTGVSGSHWLYHDL